MRHQHGGGVQVAGGLGGQRDGRVERDMYLFRVKTPAESHGEWDLYEKVATVPFKDAFRPLAEGGCPTAAETLR